MFSSQINSRDLFFSNPVDHFLGNNGGLRTSGESGFNSSNYSQNRNTSQNRNSKDLMDANNSHDIFSQSQKSNAGDVQGSADYQKYISHNLLFGKAKKDNGKQKFRSFDNDDNEQQDKGSVIEDNRISSEITEIRNLLGSLAGGIKKIHSDISAVQSSIKEVETDISKQNERMSSLHESLHNQAKSIGELDKQYKKSNKKDEIVKFRELITEIGTSKSSITQQEVEEPLFSKTPVAATVDESQKVRSSQKSLKRSSKYTQNSVHTPLANYFNQTENYFELKRNNKGNMVHNEQTEDEFDRLLFTKPQMPTEPRKLRSSLNTKAAEGRRRPNLCSQNTAHTPLNRENTECKQSERSFFLKPQVQNITTEYQKLRSRFKQQPANISRTSVYTQNSYHTPLTTSLSQSEASCPLRYMSQSNSKENVLQNQQYSRYYGFNIKRKVSPNQSPRFEKSPSCSSKCIKTVNKSQFYENLNIANQQNYNIGKTGQERGFENDRLTQKSSPYLTVNEVAKLADEFNG